MLWKYHYFLCVLTWKRKMLTTHTILMALMKGWLISSYTQVVSSAKPWTLSLPWSSIWFSSHVYSVTHTLGRRVTHLSLCLSQNTKETTRSHSWTLTGSWLKRKTSYQIHFEDSTWHLHISIMKLLLTFIYVYGICLLICIKPPIKEGSTLFQIITLKEILKGNFRLF